MQGLTDDRPVLVIIAGPNGSGKTTVTEQLLSHEWGSDCEYINPNNIARDMFGDWNSDAAVRKAAEYATQQRYSFMNAGKNIVFETVLSSDEKVDYIRKAKTLGYFVRLFFVSTDSPSINAARVTDRYMAGGHSVPIEKMVSRYSKSIVNCVRVMALVDRLYLYDNSIENEMARLLFRISDGRIVKQYVTDIPRWAESIYELAVIS